MICPYCGVKCEKVKDIYICPNHGRVYLEVDKESEEKDRGYIG